MSQQGCGSWWREKWGSEWQDSSLRCPNIIPRWLVVLISPGDLCLSQKKIHWRPTDFRWSWSRRWQCAFWFYCTLWLIKRKTLFNGGYTLFGKKRTSWQDELDWIIPCISSFLANYTRHFAKNELVCKIIAFAGDWIREPTGETTRVQEASISAWPMKLMTKYTHLRRFLHNFRMSDACDVNQNTLLFFQWMSSNASVARLNNIKWVLGCYAILGISCRSPCNQLNVYMWGSFLVHSVILFSSWSNGLVKFTLTKVTKYQGSWILEVRGVIDVKLSQSVFFKMLTDNDSTVPVSKNSHGYYLTHCFCWHAISIDQLSALSAVCTRSCPPRPESRSWSVTWRPPTPKQYGIGWCHWCIIRLMVMVGQTNIKLDETIRRAGWMNRFQAVVVCNRLAYFLTDLFCFSKLRWRTSMDVFLIELMGVPRTDVASAYYFDDSFEFLTPWNFSIY